MNNAWLKKLVEDMPVQVGNRDDFPAVLNFEFSYLLTLAKTQRLYGVVLQIKDVFETMIKIPCVMAMIILIEEYKGNPEVYSEIMDYVLSKPLSMGDWEVIAKMIIKISKNYTLPDTLIKLLKKTRRLFTIDIVDGRKIVNWRNDTLGHGALRFEDDPSYQNEVTDIFNALKEYCLSAEYGDLYIMAGARRLSGYDAELEKNDDEIRLHTADKEYPVSEFILSRQLQCFFFDSHYIRRKKTKFSAYMGGKEFTETRQFFDDLYQKLERSRLDSSVIGQDVTTRAEEKMLACLNQADDYQEPVSLIEKVGDMLEDLEKGIILIRMERGTGKTAFASRMDGYHNSKPLISNGFSRTYHLSAALLNGIDDFSYAMNFSFRHSYRADDDIYRTAQEMPVLKTGCSREDLAEFLNFYHGIYKRDYTILVLDGIDELSFDTSSLLECIPAKEQLEDGVFVILLSRFADENTVNRLSRQYIESVVKKANAVIDIRRHDPLNTGTMRSYLLKQNDLYDDPDEMIREADYRFLFLKPSVRIRRRTRLETSDETSFIRCYVDYLLSLYSEAQQKKVKELLAVIAVFPGITLDEYQKYLTYAPMSYTLIGILNDLMPLLTVKRDPKGNRFEYADMAYREYILSEYADTVKEISTMFDQFLNEQLYRVMNVIFREQETGSFFDPKGAVYGYINGRKFYDLELDEKESEARDFYSQYMISLCSLSEDKNRYFNAKTLVTLASKLSFDENYTVGYRHTIFRYLLKNILTVLDKQARANNNEIAELIRQLSNDDINNLLICIRDLDQFILLQKFIYENLDMISSQESFYWILFSPWPGKEEYAKIAEKTDISSFVREQLEHRIRPLNRAVLDYSEKFDSQMQAQVQNSLERDFSDNDRNLSHEKLHQLFQKANDYLNRAASDIDVSECVEISDAFRQMMKHSRDAQLQNEIHELCMSFYTCLESWAKYESAVDFIDMLPFDRQEETFDFILEELFPEKVADIRTEWADLLIKEDQLHHGPAYSVQRYKSINLLKKGCEEYLRRGRIEDMIAAAEKIVYEYDIEFECLTEYTDESIDFWNGFWHEFDKTAAVIGKRPMKLCWCSDNVMILINMYLKTGRTEKVEELLKTVDWTVKLLMDAFKQLKTNTKDFESQLFRFLYFCRNTVHVPVRELEELTEQSRNDHKAHIEEFLNSLTVDSDFSVLETEIENYLNYDWQLNDSENGVSHCRELIAMLRNYQDSTDMLMDETIENQINLIQNYMTDFRNGTSKTFYREKPVRAGQISFFENE